MIVGVTGGRDYLDLNHVYKIISELDPVPELIVHGNARGLDLMVKFVAKELGIPTKAFPANWDIYGRAAGPMRNQSMVDFGLDLLLAFPGGVGTKDMTDRAIKAGIKVIKV